MTRVSRSDGTRISIEFSIALPRDRDAQALGAVAIVRDVTARRVQEQVLRKWRAALDAYNAGPIAPRGRDRRAGGHLIAVKEACRPW